MTPAYVIVAAGEELILHCVLTGNGVKSWTKDDVADALTAEGNDADYTLTFASIATTDTGVYHCNNKFEEGAEGTAKDSIQVHVTGM